MGNGEILNHIYILLMCCICRYTPKEDIVRAFFTSKETFEPTLRTSIWVTWWENLQELIDYQNSTLHLMR